MNNYSILTGEYADMDKERRDLEEELEKGFGEFLKSRYLSISGKHYQLLLAEFYWNL